MQATCVIALFACACGRYGFSTSDSSTTDGPGIGAGDVAPSNACPTTVALSDDFTSTAPLAMWTVLQSPPDAMVSQGGGELTISFASMMANNANAGLALAAPTNFTDACAVFDVQMAPSSSAFGATADLAIGTGGASSHVVRFMISAGASLQSVCIITSNNQPHVDVRPYDPVAHRFLRLRNSSASGLWYWEASADGTTFTTLGSHTCSSVPPASSQLYIVGYGMTGDVNTGPGVFGPVTVYR